MFDLAAATAAPKADRATFSVGEAVEYFSATQNNWIQAKVLAANADGTYRLDCKPDVPVDRMRRPASSKALDAYAPGDALEYYSSSAQAWIAAKVLKINANGTLELDCKPDVTLDKVRETRKVGDVVEYLSTSTNKWIPAKVLRVKSSGLYDLDCKPDVPAGRIRAPAAPGGPGGSQDAGAAPAAAPPAELAVGDVVEYRSTTHGTWLRTKVTAVNANGTYDLDCKPGVSASAVRRVEVTGDSAYAIGDRVEYFGASQARWITAKVLAVNANGTYDLDVKPGVKPESIRRPAGPPDGSPARSPHMVGDLVEYFGATLGKWIPARVRSIGPGGSYDLDCKPGAPADRVRKPLLSQELSRDILDAAAAGAAAGTASSSPSAAAMEAAPGFAKPRQLLSARRSGRGWRFEVCPDAAAALEALGSRRLGVVSACGPRGAGTSALLSALRGSGDPPTAPTSGLWMSVSTQSDAGPVLAFLDCEAFGTGPEDQSRDAQLLAIVSLLSSLLLLVSTGGSVGDRQLADLAPACRFADAVEERGQEAGRPSLLWVLRDADARLRDERGADETPEEHLERCLRSTSGADNSEQDRAAQETRRSLLHFFKQRSCAALPPAEQAQALQTATARLREQVVSTCLTNPKAVGGQALGCFSFVQLLRQLVAAANDGRIMNIKAAWETVQHTTCGTLADELREAATAHLRALAAGGQVPGGAALPMAEEDLRTVLRDQRHALKDQWEERALGDEIVRREYWQELKESLAREEGLVRTQNAKLADQRGREALQSWQDWLDGSDEGAAGEAGEVCRRLGLAMDRMPARPLSRISRAAVQAAARHVAEARSAVLEAESHHGDLRQRAVALGERAAHQEGAARTALETKESELDEAQRVITEMEQATARIADEQAAKTEELKEAEAQLKAVLAELDGARAREREQATRQRSQLTTQEALQGEVEQARADAARDDAARLAAEWQAEVAANAGAGERRRLEEALAETRAEGARCTEALAQERAAHEGRLEEARREHSARVEQAQRQLHEDREGLHGKHQELRNEHQTKVERARGEVEEQRKAHAAALDEHRNQLLEKERHTGVLEGRLHAMSAEAELLRQRGKDLEAQLRRAEVLAAERAEERGQLERDLRASQAVAARTKLEAQTTRETLERDPDGLARGEVEEVRGKGCGLNLRRLIRRRAAGAGA